MADDDETGFTLVEVLVALVMAALLTVILVDGASIARRRGAHAEAERKAVFVARMLLAHGAVATLDTYPSSGTANGLPWRLDEHVIMTDPRGLYDLVELTATVADQTGASLFTASTRRLKAVPRS